MMRIATVLFSLFLLAGCAGLSEEECLTANWQIIGFEDGAAGHSAARIGEHRQDCARYGVSPDKSAYDEGYAQGIRQYCSLGRGRNAGAAGNRRAQVCPADADYHAGYDQGLESFCRYDSGYDYGLDGGSYQRVCPSGMEEDFLDGYIAGKAIYDLRRELSQLENELEELVAERADIEAEQDALKEQIVLDDSLSSKQRAELLLDIDELRDLDDELEAAEDSLLAEISALRSELAALGVDV